LLLIALAAGASACGHAGATGEQPAHSPSEPLAAHAPAPALARPTPSADARVNTEMDAASVSGADSAPRSLAPRPAAERGWLGVELAMRQPNEPGVLVRDVVRGSPAASSGVVAGDVIISVDGEDVARSRARSVKIL